MRTTSKTVELRKLIKTQLETIQNSGKTYYRIAEKNAIYPHKVFTFETVDLNTPARDDLQLIIDIWTKNANAADNIADAVEELFNNKNLPQSTILPTFYKIDRKPIDDEDRTIERRQIRILIQNYEREVAQ